jgi:23S rRNA (guanosine2251-2'-O)-methyltransferase
MSTGRSSGRRSNGTGSGGKGSGGRGSGGKGSGGKGSGSRGSGGKGAGGGSAPGRSGPSRQGARPSGRPPSGRTSRQPSGSAGGAKGLGGRQIEGRQAVRELLIAERRKVHEVWISAELEGDAGVADIVEIAAARRIPLLHVAKARLEREARSEAPQGVLAHAAEIPEADLADLIGGRGARNPFLVAVDGVTDPGNLGAIIRTCDAAGVTGVLLPRHRAVHVTPTVAKSAAGAVEYVPMALVPGLPAALRQLTERGIWIVGLDDGADRGLYDIGSLAAEPICLVLGAEGAGLSRLVRERCDSIVGIPMAGHVSSLNVSAAAAVSLYEVARLRLQVS